MRRIDRFALSVFLLFVPLAAFAQDAAPPLTDDVGQLADVILRAVASGDWQLVAAAAVVLIVFFARRFGSAYVPWLGTHLGGIALAFGASAAGMALTAVLAGAPITGVLVFKAVLTGLIAIGTHQVSKVVEKARADGKEAASAITTDEQAASTFRAPPA